MSAVHSASRFPSPEQTRNKIRGYLKVFCALIVLTVVEIAALELKRFGWSHFAVTSVVVFFSCAKAAAVGYFFMHLNHERRWLKIVACAPLIAVIYAVVLVREAPIAEKPSNYLPEWPREYRTQQHEEGHGGAHDGAKTSEEHSEPAASEKAVEGSGSSPVVGTGAAPMQENSAPKPETPTNVWQ